MLIFNYLLCIECLARPGKTIILNKRPMANAALYIIAALLEKDRPILNVLVGPI